MKLREIWNIWYPPTETFSWATRYSIDQANQKLAHAADADDEIRGTFRLERISIGYTTYLWGRRRSSGFNGYWRKEPFGLVLNGAFSSLIFLPLFMTLALIICVVIELGALTKLAIAIAEAVFYSTFPLSGETLSLILLFIAFPPLFLGFATAIVALVNGQERRLHKNIARFIQRALK